MSTIAILIFIAIGLVLLMRLNDREEGREYVRYRGSSLAGYIIAVGVLLGIGVLVLRRTKEALSNDQTARCSGKIGRPASS